MSNSGTGVRIDAERPRTCDDPLQPPRNHEAPAAGAMELFVCDDCGDVIGIYEPLVASDNESTRTTSRAAEPDLEAAAAAYYHRECYTALTLPRSAGLPA